MQPETVIAVPRRRMLTLYVISLLWPFALAGYGLLVGGSGERLVGLLVICGLGLLVRLVLRPPELFGPPPAMNADGMLLRWSRWQQRELIPWSRVRSIWIAYGRRRLYLFVLAVSPSGTILRVRLPIGVDRAALANAVRTNSDGTVEVADDPPFDLGRFMGDEGRRGFRWQSQIGRSTRTPLWWFAPSVVVAVVAVLGLVIVIPRSMDKPTPWQQYWWPGVQVADAAPDPCAALDAVSLRDVFGSARPHPVASPLYRECEIDGPEVAMTVIVLLEQGYFTSGADRATSDARELAAGIDAPSSPVAGVGDEAWIAEKGSGEGLPIEVGATNVVARRVNVVVVVFCHGVTSQQLTRTTALDTARRAIRLVEVR